MSKKLSKICQICTFLSHYVYTFVYTWKTLFFCLNFGPFWIFLSHCVQGVYGHFFHKNFYHFFIFYFFTKFYFSLTPRRKLEYNIVYTTILYAICFKKSIKKWSKFWSKNYRFFAEVQFENSDRHSPWYKREKFVKFSIFWLSGWPFLYLYFFYFLLKIFYDFFLKIAVILRDTIGYIIWKKVKIFAKIY